jgi:integrase
MPVGVRKVGKRYEWNVSFKGKRRYGHASTEEEAVYARAVALKNLKENLKGNKEAKQQKVALLELIEQCWNGAGGWSECRSWQTIQTNLNQIKEFFGNPFIDEITENDIDNFVAWLREKNNSRATINRKLALLRKMMGVAYKRGYIQRKLDIRLHKETQGRVRYLSEKEEKTLLELAIRRGEYDVYDVIVVLLDTGIRWGELLKLTSKDIDWNQGKFGVLHIWETKTNFPRSVPMTERVKDILKKRAKKYRGRLFPYHQFWLRSRWVKLKEEMGLKEDHQFVPHCLRHTCASRLVQRGVPFVVVKEWLGHKSERTTLRYAHIAPETLYKAVEVL